MPAGWRVADLISGMRLLLIPVVWVLALLGFGRAVGVALLSAGVTDFLDGYLARRLGQESRLGARLDSLADNLLLLSAAVWIQLLHPEILRENIGLIATTFGVYVASLAVGLVKFRQLGNLHLYSSKVAGGLLYSFAIITLVVGRYEPLLLALAAAAFIVSSTETLLAQLVSPAVDENMGSVLLVRSRRAESRTIQAIDNPRKERSQTPQPVKSVGSIASATSSIATSDAPNPNETLR